MNKYLIFIIIHITTFIAAQQDSTKLQIKQVEVVKSFEAILEDAKKVNLKPILPTPSDFKPSYKYDITIVPAVLNYQDPQIKPLAMNPDGPFIVKKGFLHGGYGLRKNPELLAGYHFSKKDKFDAGIQINYEALDNSAKNAWQKYSNTGIDLYANYLVKENMKIFGKIETDFRKRYFFHTDLGIDTLFNEMNTKRSINSYNIIAGIGNPEPTKYNVNYTVQLNLRNMTTIDAQRANDNGLGINGKIEKHFTKGTVFSLDANYEYSAFSGGKELSLSTATLLPLLKTKIKNVIIHGGVNMLYSSDGNSAIFPEVMVFYGLAGQKLQVFAGLSQHYYTNHFTNLIIRNPYISTNMDSLQNTIFQEYSGGLKGKFSFINYQVKAGYKNVKQQMFLLNNRDDLRLFNMLYDDVGIVFITGNLDFTFTENITFGGWVNQNIFSLNTLKNAWHTPNLEANVYASITLLESRFRLRGDLYFGNSVPFINKQNETTKSNVLFDLNLTAEYQIFNQFSIFIKGINLLDNKFERWYGYPSVGINGMAGLKVVF